MRELSHQTGFTLVEVLIVIVLVVIIAKFALTVSFDTYRASSYHADRAYLIAALQHARALSVNDVCEGAACTSGAPHGVSIQTDRYIVFQGSSYAARDPSFDEVIGVNPAIDRTGLDEVVFIPGSGDVSIPGDIALTDLSGRTSTVTIGSYGQISWSN